MHFTDNLISLITNFSLQYICLLSSNELKDKYSEGRVEISKIINSESILNIRDTRDFNNYY